MIAGSRRRNHRIGSTIAEAPLALWIVIMAMAFPLLILVMTSLKYAFFWNAARDACKQACSAQTFENPPPSGQSAVAIATSVANAAAASFDGITIIPPVNVFIIRTDLTTGNPEKLAVPNQRLQGSGYAPPDPENYFYSIQVELDGNVEPLIRHPGVGALGIPIPGLTAPFRVSVTSQQPFENTQGLDD